MLYMSMLDLFLPSLYKKINPLSTQADYLFYHLITLYSFDSSKIFHFNFRPVLPVNCGGCFPEKNICSLSSTCRPAELWVNVRMTPAREQRTAAVRGQTGPSWVGLIRGGCFLTATSQYPLPNPHHRGKKKSLRPDQESEK